MNLVILGPQGSGKGTQANALAEEMDLLHVEMGLILRTMASEDSELGRKIDKIIHEDKNLVDDEVVISALEDALDEIPKDKGVIFDGVPRTVSQIDPFEKILENHGRKIDNVIYISLPREESVGRISKRYHCKSCGTGLILGKDFTEDKKECSFCKSEVEQRSDDTVEGVNKRLDVFYAETLPVIEEFKKRNLLVEVDGRGTVEEISKKVRDNLKL